MSTPTPLKVLYAVHPDLDTLDFTGPLEILSHATHPSSSSAPTPAFTHTITSITPLTTTHQGLTFQRDIPMALAHSTLASYDILVIPGGGSPGVLEGKTEPLDLIEAFAALPKKEDGSVRVLLSVCTGSLFLAEAGVLDGMTATTHPRYYGQLREIVKVKGEGKTKVVEERFVVNRTDVGAGLRIITAGGVSSGIDAALWLVGDVVGEDVREKIAEIVQHAHRSGVVL
ncbi:class I glutamine amidotransferase-like protein [Hyaloscypha bicolor E]|uniref:Class I glutamine amidotransferase-like protein n=1 Tax=Hyaloscypha bicolor E TaxID=1095630 RepID=A0A2J6TLC8_9HELO|nr:class I glutamine amidotransferase-like protein [Hyaloscypha bicolor E]PMD63788.1 class I glutamine amidotransferase-like protein [Hyaloscypha bicolor E]